MDGPGSGGETEREVFLLEGVGVFQTDPGGLIVRSNEAFCALLGYTETELRGLSLAALTDAAPAESGGEGVRFRRKDGAPLTVELHTTWFGNYALSVAYSRSETPNVAPLSAFPTALYTAPSAPVMVWVTNSDGLCTFLSRSWYDFTGQTSETGLGFGWLEAVHPDDRELTKATFNAANRAQSPFRLDYRLRRQDGLYRWALDAATPHHGADGAFLGYIGSVIDITERKEAEAALRASEARYRGLLSSIDEGFCVIEMLLDDGGRPVDYRFLEFNPAFAGQTGLEAERTLGRTALELIPDLEPFWVETYGRVALTGESVRFVNESQPLGRWFDVHASRLGGPESLKVALLFKDITESKRAETALAELNATLERRVAERTAELRRSERRFSQAFSAGPVAACITALDLRTLLEVNEAFLRLTGYSRDEAVGRAGGALGLWALREDEARLERAAGGAGAVDDLELRLRTKSGALRDVVLSAAIIRLEDLYGYLVTFTDVTRRKEAEAGRELLRQALDNAEESVIVTTADLQDPKIVYVNAAFSSVTGYSAAEVLGGTPGLLHGPESDVLVWERMRRDLAAGRSTQGEMVNYRKDGSQVVLAWSVAAISGPEGRSHYVATQRDVTRRRALERELFDLTAQEQRRVVGDLYDSVQQQLVGAALEAKRVATLAETRFPELSADLDALVAHIQGGVRGVRAVLGELTPVQPTENGLMVALENLCRRISALFGVPCRFSFEQPLFERDWARATHLFFIAQEAAVNAAKHAAAARIDVRLTGTPERFSLSVTDDGSGVNERVLQASPGTGFRLMRERAELLGVPLEVVSEPGRGTTVSVSLGGEGV